MNPFPGEMGGRSFGVILRVEEVEVLRLSMLRLAFNDGVRKDVDLRPLLNGPIFEPLHAPDFFRRVTLDRVCGTVVWPNGADFAPEALRDLAAIEEPSRV